MLAEHFIYISDKQLNDLQKLDLSDNDFATIDLPYYNILCNNLSQCHNLKMLNLGDHNIAFLSIQKFRMLRKALSKLTKLKIS